MDSHRLAGRATVLGEDGNATFIGPPWSIVGTGMFDPRTSRPKAPTGLRVTDVADRKISVAWLDQSDNEDGFRSDFAGREQNSAIILERNPSAATE
jgi:hypothetical protein